MDAKHIVAEKALVDTALTALRELGIEAEVERQQPKLGRAQADALIRVRHGDQEILYAADVKRELRPALLGVVLQHLERLGEQGLLVTDYVTPPLADALRARRVAFIDTAGNAYLDRPPLLVWVKGQRPANRHVPHQMGRAFRASGLQVTFALLCRPELVDHPYRKIAKLVGVAHGTVGWVMAELPKLGFVAEVGHKRRLLQPERLLQQWVEAYARTLRPKLVLGRFKAERLDWWETVDVLKYGLTMGGEGAVARDLLLFYAHGIRAARATEDVDLALAVADWNDFERLRESLLAAGSFSPVPKAAYKLLHRRRIEVDLIPFGGVELPDGTIAW